MVLVHDGIAAMASVGVPEFGVGGEPCVDHRQASRDDVDPAGVLSLLSLDDVT